MQSLAELIENGITLQVYLNAEEKRLIIQALEQSGYNQSKAAKLLGENRTRLVRKVQKYDLVAKCQEERAKIRDQHWKEKLKTHTKL